MVGLGSWITLDVDDLGVDGQYANVMTAFLRSRRANDEPWAFVWLFPIGGLGMALQSWAIPEIVIFADKVDIRSGRYWAAD